MNCDRPMKEENLLQKIKKYIDSGNYIITKHAVKRRDERSVLGVDIMYVLQNGFHEEDKTSFSTKYQAWNYAIRGKTVDGIDLRVIVGFMDKMVVITVIKILKKMVRKYGR